MELLTVLTVICMLVGTPLVVIITLVQMFQKGKINFKSLEQILHSKTEWRFPLQFVIRGTYKGREVTSILFPALKIPPFINSRCGKLSGRRAWFVLFVKPNKDLLLKKSNFLDSCYELDKLTEFTQLHYDRNIYYIKNDVENDCRGFWIGSPRLDYEKDKQSLIALYGLVLSKEDILFFLDELEKAAKIAESANWLVSNKMQINKRAATESK